MEHAPELHVDAFFLCQRSIKASSSLFMVILFTHVASDPPCGKTVQGSL